MLHLKYSLRKICERAPCRKIRIYVSEYYVQHEYKCSIYDSDSNYYDYADDSYQGNTHNHKDI